MTRVLGLIPARGGSKGVPRKAVRPLAGKPLIGWTIEAALASEGLERVAVTSEDAEIIEVATAFGADVPFVRPAELAADDSPGMDSVIHALRWLEREEGYAPQWVMLLQPTSPLRTSGDIDAVVRLAIERGGDSVVSVTEAADHPWWTKRLDEQGRLHDFVDRTGGAVRRQELPAAYALNGAIYLALREQLLRQRSWYSERTSAYVMPPERSLDIDTPWDFQLADLVLSRSGKAEGP